MKIFVDSANLSEIEQALERGFVSGVTTNPNRKANAMLLKAGNDQDEIGFEFLAQRSGQAIIVFSRNFPYQLAWVVSGPLSR